MSTQEICRSQMIACTAMLSFGICCHCDDPIIMIHVHPLEQPRRLVSAGLEMSTYTFTRLLSEHKVTKKQAVTAVKCMMVIDSLSGERLCWFEQGDGEPEGAALPHFGHSPQQAPQHRHLLGADAKAKPCSSPSSGALHVILCPLCRPATFKHKMATFCRVSCLKTQNYRRLGTCGNMAWLTDVGWTQQFIVYTEHPSTGSCM